MMIVSECMEAPLYRMDSSDLGYDLERNLKRAMELCTRWGAILLIDEADVYLEARSADSFSRNDKVSGNFESLLATDHIR